VTHEEQEHRGAAVSGGLNRNWVWKPPTDVLKKLDSGDKKYTEFKRKQHAPRPAKAQRS
jgi:hypothetical protein